MSIAQGPARDDGGRAMSETRVMAVAGETLRHCLIDGIHYIWFPTDEKWARQAPSEWDKKERWVQEAAYLRRALANAQAMVALHEQPFVGGVASHDPTIPPPDPRGPEFQNAPARTSNTLIQRQDGSNG